MQCLIIPYYDNCKSSKINYLARFSTVSSSFPSDYAPFVRCFPGVMFDSRTGAWEIPCSTSKK